MSFYRTLLWWLLLATVGALIWQWLSLDPGTLVIAWHGITLSTSVAFFLLGWALLWFLAWLLWTLLSLPFTAWHRLAQREARHRLAKGLLALHVGRDARAESLLTKAAEHRGTRTAALLVAREAARARGDLGATARWHDALSKDDPLAAALAAANDFLMHGLAQEALTELWPFSEKGKLPPRGLFLLGDALCACGRAGESLILLDALRNESTELGDRFEAASQRWHEAAQEQSKTIVR